MSLIKFFIKTCLHTRATFLSELAAMQGREEKISVMIYDKIAVNQNQI